MAHEDLTREQSAEGSSDRVLGLIFVGVFLLIAGSPLFHGETPQWWAFGVLRKKDQDPALKQNYETAFALD